MEIVAGAYTLYHQAASDDWREMSLLKDIIEYEILLRHDGERLTQSIAELNRIKKEVYEICQIYELDEWDQERIFEFLFYYIQTGRKLWTYLDELGLKYDEVFDNGYYVFIYKVLKYFHLRVRAAVRNSKVLQQFCFESDKVGNRNDLENIYSWWCYVTDKNVRKENGWKGKVCATKVVYQDMGGGEKIYYREGWDNPGFVPKRCKSLIMDLYWSDQKSRDAKLKKLCQDEVIKKKNLFACHAMLELMDESSSHKKDFLRYRDRDQSILAEYDKRISALRKDAFAPVRGRFAMKTNQVGPRLVGLMCWDARKEGRTIDQAVEKVMTDISAEYWSEKGGEVHSKLINWQGEVNKRINAGEF
ncbi:hypothetical protein [Chromobacterium violaceum]|uniref:hypothetical protein n=1 Tax=Chromobacterium violaceum TaxID=536 RepID=UPI000B099618|nr:hypothetical protein [Chromobacterium violaceum]